MLLNGSRNCCFRSYFWSLIRVTYLDINRATYFIFNELPTLMLLNGSRNCCFRSFVWFLIISTLQLMLLDIRSMLVEMFDIGPATSAASIREYSTQRPYFPSSSGTRITTRQRHATDRLIPTTRTTAMEPVMYTDRKNSMP